MTDASVGPSTRPAATGWIRTWHCGPSRSAPWPITTAAGGSPSCGPPLLAEVVRELDQHESVDAALTAAVPRGRAAAYRRALASLADSRFIRAC